MTQPVATLAYKHALLGKLEALSRNDFDEFDRMRSKYASFSAEEILDYAHKQVGLIDDTEYEHIKGGWMQNLRYIVRRFGQALELVGRHGPELNCVLLQAGGSGPPRVFIEHDEYLVDVVIMVRRDTTIMKGAASSEADSLRELQKTVETVLHDMESSGKGQSQY
ncbi:MAG: hypothetical protein QNK04_00465 [Myxococcota bacterium]|nr:hypothetical protein [Myxococcota bacterium]